MSDHRLIFHIGLEPALGSIFQPTGFPDVGAAVFQRPVRRNGDKGDEVELRSCLLVESAQSMANHLEATAWDAARQSPVPEFEGLPWVRVLAHDDGRFLTSSRLEAHRVAASYVKDAELDRKPMKGVIRDRLGLREKTPLDYREVAAAVFALDPLCLVHGVFFAEDASVWPGQPKIARAMAAVVEADDVKPVVSGGVKRELVRHTVKESDRDAKKGYGSIPFHRQEFTAASITLHANLDRLQLRSYGLGEDAADLLEAIALWELRSLLDRGLRLRTACDLLPLPDTIPPDLPTADDLARRIRAGVAACSDRLGPGGPIDVVWTG